MKRVQIRKGVRRRAFTLLEVLMVIVILGVLAALAAQMFGGQGEDARRRITALQVKNLEDAIERFKMSCERYPTQEEGLAALVTKPDAEDLASKWAGPYFKETIKDGWGREMNYRYPSQYNGDSIDLWSNGKDGAEGTEDDITNWKKAG